MRSTDSGGFSDEAAGPTEDGGAMTARGGGQSTMIGDPLKRKERRHLGLERKEKKRKEGRGVYR